MTDFHPAQILFLTFQHLENTNNLLRVLDVMNTNIDIGYTPSDTLLRGKWDIVHRQGHPPLWHVVN